MSPTPPNGGGGANTASALAVGASAACDIGAMKSLTGEQKQKKMEGERKWGRAGGASRVRARTVPLVARQPTPYRD